MKCSNHPETDALGACVYCGRLFCAACLVEANGKNYCKADVGRVIQETKEQGRQLPVATPPAEKRSGLKTAARVLVIIFGIIGIIWGLSAPILAGCSAVAVAMSEASDKATSTISTATTLAESAGRILASLIFIIAGMVLGLIASSISTKKTSTIVLGSLVIVMGIVSSILLQVVSGPVFVLCGILLLVAGLKQKAPSTVE